MCWANWSPIGDICAIAEDRRFHTINSIQQLVDYAVGSWCVGLIGLQSVIYTIALLQKIDIFVQRTLFNNWWIAQLEVDVHCPPIGNIHDCAIVEDRPFHTTNFYSTTGGLHSWKLMRRANYPPIDTTHGCTIAEGRLLGLVWIVWFLGINLQLIIRHNWNIWMDLFWGIGRTIFHRHFRRSRVVVKLMTNVKCFWSNEYQKDSRGKPVHA